MAGISELIKTEADGGLSFGDYTLSEKKKLTDFMFEGDSYKIKTFAEITKLEQNDMFVFESIPGTTVHSFKESAEELSFMLEGNKDVQVTLGLEEETEYEIFLDGSSEGIMSTNFSGKLTFSAELNEGKSIAVKIVRK